MSTSSPTRLTGAFVFAALAAIAFWWGWFSGFVPQDMVFSVLFALAIAAPLLVLLGRAQPPLLNAAGIILTVQPVVAITLLFVLARDAETLLAGLRLWPLVITTVCAGFAVGLLGQSLLRVSFLQGAFLLALGASLLEVAGMTDLVDRWVIRTPVHLCIMLVALVVLSAVVRGFTQGGAVHEERFISSLTQLLPLLGFAGTIWGITLALRALPDVFAAEAGSDPEALNAMLLGLATAFETTLLGVGAGIAMSFLTALLPD